MGAEAVHLEASRTVRFAIYPKNTDGLCILAEISSDALEALFGAHRHPQSLVDACRVHFEFIEAVALHRYRSFPLAAIRLQTQDFFSQERPFS